MAGFDVAGDRRRLLAGGIGVGGTSGAGVGGGQIEGLGGTGESPRRTNAGLTHLA